MSDEELLKRMTEGQLDPLDLPPDELIARLARPEMRIRIATQCELGDIQSRLVAARYRPTVMTRLLTLATRDDASPETVRRACIDILKLYPPDTPAEPFTPESDPTAPLRNLLEDNPPQPPTPPPPGRS